MNKVAFILFSVLFYTASQAQTIQVLAKKEKLSLRGLSVINNKTFWVSGTNGTVGRSIDAGKNVEWLSVAGYEKRDFRDIEGFGKDVAVIMAIDNPAVILKTYDGGQSWKKVYEKEMKGMFLDAMAFDGAHGACVGDPIDGKLWTLESFDSGNTWLETPFEFRPKAPESEAVFAASGSNIQFLTNDKKYAWAFVTGGRTSSLIKMGRNGKTTPQTVPLPMQGGKESTGAFSWAISGKKAFAVGGDYVAPTQDAGNNAVSYDAGNTWQSFPNSLRGFKSGVIWTDSKTLVACGTSGIAIARNVGDKTAPVWKDLSDAPFHAIQKAKNGDAVYLAGPDGVIAVLTNQSDLID